MAREYTQTSPGIASPAFTLNAAHNFNSHLTVSGAAYYRYVRADTTNGDLNDDSFTESLYNLSAADIAALTAAGYSGFPLTGNSATQPFPFWRCLAQALEFSEPSEKCTGVFTRTYDKQNSWGTSEQGNWLTERNSLTFGTSWGFAAVSPYQQNGQFGYLNPDGVSITPINSFEDGSTNANGAPVDTRVNLHGTSNAIGSYATDTFRPAKNLAITLSGRFNHASILNIDRIAGTNPSRGSLNGDYAFNRLNPAAGIVYTPVPFASVYFSYSEANRVPTAIELGCADPTLPCNLPNALVADPPLKQVVAKTFEAGVRSAGQSKIRWSAGWFRAENTNDILFIASQQTGFGYFVNYGKTLRQGAEVSLSRNFKWFTIGGNYTFLDATFQSTQLLTAAANSTNDGGPGLDGNITVVPGDEIPQTPRNILKAYLDFHPIKKLVVDVDFNAVGRSRARQRKQFGPTGWSLLSRSRLLPRVRSHERRRPLSAIQQATALRADGQHLRSSLLHCGPAQYYPRQCGELYPVLRQQYRRGAQFDVLFARAPFGVFGGMKFTF